MSIIPPTELPYGPLEMHEVYFDHDGPRLFSLRATELPIWIIAVCVAEDEDTTSYLYLVVSEGRFWALRSGALSLREGFVDPSATVWLVVADFAGDDPFNQIVRMAPADILDEWLPLPGARIGIETETRPAFSRDRLTRDATDGVRTVGAIELDPSGATITELPLRDLGRITESLQDSLNALAQEEEGSATTVGRIAQGITSEVAMNVYDLQAASFVIVFGTNKQGRLLEREALVNATLDRLIRLIDASTDSSALVSELRGYGPRARGHFRRLLERINETGSGVSLYAAAPGSRVRQGRLSLSGLRSAIDTISGVRPEHEILTLDRVWLTALNTTRYTFEITDTKSGLRYSGSIAPEARAAANGLLVGDTSVYQATVDLETDFTAVAEESSRKYALMAIETASALTSEDTSDLRLLDEPPF